MTSAQKVIGVLVLVIVVLGVVFLSGGAPSGQSAQPEPQLGVASVNRYEAGVWWFGNGLYGGTTQQWSVDASGNVVTTGSVAIGSGNGVILQGTQASCANTASSTQFAVQPPSSATSTVTLTMMQIGGNATTSSLVIGTSTTPSPSTASSVSASLVNSSNGIATSSVQWTASGNMFTSGLGFINAGANSARTIVVKPGEYVVAFSTSTASNGGAVQYSPGFTTCNYTLEWRH